MRAMGRGERESRRQWDCKEDWVWHVLRDEALRADRIRHEEGKDLPDERRERDHCFLGPEHGGT